MKRILCVTCGILMLASSAVAEETCANGKGRIGTDADGNRYCVSSVKMNWFSAFSWCETAGGRLPTLEDCNCKSCNQVETPVGCVTLNKVVYPYSGNIWTGTIVDSNKVYAITEWGHKRTPYSKSNVLFAACKMP